MTRYLERALAGHSASPDEWNEHLIAFHRAFPNVTPNFVGRFTMNDGENSYQRLARHVHDRNPNALRIVEVGCGSGELLFQLDALFNGAAELTGVDLVASELELARSRVSRARLICVDVAERFPHENVDVVVAHLTFLSMARLRDALVRIHAALRASGLLTFMIEDPIASESVIAMMAPLMGALHERYPDVNFIVPERDGIENEATLRALLEASGFADDTEIEPLVLSAYLSDDEIIEFALHGYPFGLLGANEQQNLRERLRASLSRNDGTLVKLPLKLVTARRQDAISSIKPSTATEYVQ